MIINIVWVLIGIIFTVFLLFTVKILFVFIRNLKSNKIINKSVVKQIFSGKLSLSIIMLFFAISFSLVGGAQILNTLGSRSILKQFTENHLYQNQLKGYIFKLDDEFQYDALMYRNSLITKNDDSYLKVNDHYFVNTWLIDNTLLWYNNGDDYNHQNDRFKTNEKGSYWFLNNSNGDVILNTENLNPEQPFFKDYNLDPSKFFINNTKSYGWTENEYLNALYLDFKHIFIHSQIWKDYQVINNYKDSFSEFADKMVSSYFDDGPNWWTSWLKYGQMIGMLRVFDNYHPKDIKITNNDYLKPFLKKSVSNFYYNQNTSKVARNNLKKYMNTLSYINTAYYNGAAKFSVNKKTYEFVIKNNIDWSTGEYLNPNDNNPLVKTRTTNRKNINQTTYLSGIKSDKQFLSKAKKNVSKKRGGKEKYNITFQNEFLQKNNLKIGDSISLNNTTDFNIVASTKFNEVTYPIIGKNIVSNMKDSAFVGINLTDYVNLKSNNEFISIDNEVASFYFGINEGYKKLNKLSLWSKNSSAFRFIDNKVNYFNKNINNATQSYNINIEDIKSFKNILIKSGISASFWNKYINFDDSKYIFKSYYLMSSKEGIHNFGITKFISNGITSINDLSSLPSIRAKLGVEQISKQESIINFLVIIFITIVLIVISMLVTKRIKTSGKQLGTLKAMGMNNNFIAASYILFPLIIIFSGFIVASIMSIPVAISMISLMKGFYYITFTGNPLSFLYFVKMLFIPMTLSIGMTYIISIKTLRKPTLNLLNNKDINYPNIFVRFLGYITPPKTPFILSYTSKGFLRAMGKSSLLFFSIFISTFLVAFSLSSTTMLKKQTEAAFKYVNLRSISKNSRQNTRRYSVKPEFLESKSKTGDDHSKIEIAYKKNEIGIDIKWNMDLTKNFNSINWKEKYYNYFLDRVENTLKNLKGGNGEDTVLFSYNGVPGSEGWKDGQPWTSKYYFTKNFMVQTSLAFELSRKMPEFKLWENKRKSSSSDSLIFKNLEPLIKSWILTVYGNAVFNHEKIPELNTSPASIMELIKLIIKYGTDLTLNEQYYNQYQQYMASQHSVFNYQCALNYKNIWDYTERKVKDECVSKMNVMDSLESIRNAFGAKGTNIGEKLYKSLKPYEDIIGKNNIKKSSEIDYIPVIISSYDQKKLDDAAKKGLVIPGQEGDVKTYITSSYMNVVKGALVSKSNNYYFVKWQPRRFMIKVGIINKLYTGINLHMTTTRKIYNNYFKYYFNHNFNGQVTDYKYHKDKKSLLVFKKKDDSNDYDYIIRYQHDPYAEKTNISEVIEVSKIEKKTQDQENIFVSRGLVQYNENTLGTYSFSKNMLKDWKNYGSLIKNNKIFPVASVTLEKFQGWYQRKTKHEGPCWKRTYQYTVKNLLTSDHKYCDKLAFTQGFPTTIQDLLDQIQTVYKLTVAIFNIISFFAVFIAATVIIIAIKDIADSSKREVAMLKSFGYTNLKSTILILMPYIIIIAISFLIALPISFYGLGIVAVLLESLTGNAFTFTLSLLQWIFLSCFITGIVIMIFLLTYISFYNSKPLEAIKATDE